MTGRALTQRNLVSFGFLLFTSSTGSFVQMMYLTLYMTDFLRIPPAMAAVIILAARVVDFIIRLFTDLIIDRVHFSWGKYRSWLLILRWVALGALFLEFWPFTGMPLGVRLLAVCLGFILHNAAMGVSTAAYNALAPLIAGTDMDSRIQMEVYGYYWRTAATLVVTAVTIPLVLVLMPALGAFAFTLVAMLFCVPFIVGARMVSNLAKKADPDGTVRTLRPPVAVKDVAEALRQNRLLVLLLIVFILYSTANQIEMYLRPYYYIYLVGNFSLLALGSTVAFVVSLLFSVYMPAVGRKLGKRKALIAGLLLCGICTALKYYAGSDWVLYVGIGILSTGSTYVFSRTIVNYFIDAGEYHYWKTGQDLRQAHVFIFTFPLKLGFMAASAVAVFFLASIGYRPRQAFTPEMASGFRFVLNVVPALMHIAAMVIFAAGYRLKDTDGPRYARMSLERDLERKEKDASAE